MPTCVLWDKCANSARSCREAANQQQCLTGPSLQTEVLLTFITGRTNKPQTGKNNISCSPKSYPLKKKKKKNISQYVWLQSRWIRTDLVVITAIKLQTLFLALCNEKRNSEDKSNPARPWDIWSSWEDNEQCTFHKNFTRNKSTLVSALWFPTCGSGFYHTILSK